jgi:hypothetical protein
MAVSKNVTSAKQEKKNSKKKTQKNEQPEVLEPVEEKQTVNKSMTSEKILPVQSEEVIQDKNVQAQTEEVVQDKKQKNKRVSKKKVDDINENPQNDDDNDNDNDDDNDDDDDDDNDDDKKKKKTAERHFKRLYVNSSGDVICSGRYGGIKPEQAANKAFTRLCTHFKKNGVEIPKMTVFGVVECTRASKKKKKYYYEGERRPLEEEVKVYLKQENPETGEKEPKINPTTGEQEFLVYNFENKVTKLVNMNDPHYRLLREYEPNSKNIEKKKTKNEDGIKEKSAKQKKSKNVKNTNPVIDEDEHIDEGPIINAQDDTEQEISIENNTNNIIEEDEIAPQENTKKISKNKTIVVKKEKKGQNKKNTKNAEVTSK